MQACLESIIDIQCTILKMAHAAGENERNIRIMHGCPHAGGILYHTGMIYNNYWKLLSLFQGWKNNE